MITRTYSEALNTLAQLQYLIVPLGAKNAEPQDFQSLYKKCEQSKELQTDRIEKMKTK